MASPSCKESAFTEPVWFFVGAKLQGVLLFRCFFGVCFQYHHLHQLPQVFYKKIVSGGVGYYFASGQAAWDTILSGIRTCSSWHTLASLPPGSSPSRSPPPYPPPPELLLSQRASASSRTLTRTHVARSLPLATLRLPFTLTLTLTRHV